MRAFLRGAAMSARKSPSFVDSHLSNRQSPQGRIPAAGSERRQSAAPATGGRFPLSGSPAGHRPAAEDQTPIPGEISWGKALTTPRMLMKKRSLCAGINRQEAEDEKSSRERSSEPLGPEFCAVGREACREA